MKRIIHVLLLAFISSSIYSQTSSGVWNGKTSTYTNSTHNITWQLIEDWDWVGRPILEKTTLLKVRNDDTHIMAKLGATTMGKFDGDIWEYVSMFESDDATDLSKQLAIHNGMEYLGTKAIKSQLCGIHAVKTRTDMKKYYPEHEQTVHSVEITYSFYRNGYLYTVSIIVLSCLEEEITDFDRIATKLFNGFKIK